MADLLLVPGSDGRAWFWHRVVPELTARGHRAAAVDLPLEATATWRDYRGACVEAARRELGHGPLVVVGQSMGAFTAPLLVGELDVRALVLVNPMVPAPGETAGAWWEATGQGDARREAAAAHGWPAEFDLQTGFFHDVPDDVTAAAMAAGEGAALDGVFADPWPLDRWPAVPTAVVLSRDDRFFPLGFQRRVVAGRLGAVPVREIPGGHLSALSQPVALAEAITALLPPA